MAFRLTQWPPLRRDWLSPARIVGLYAGFSILWILASGYLVIVSFDDSFLAHLIEILKGALFVVVTSGLLYLLLRGWAGKSPGQEPPRTVLRSPEGSQTMLLIIVAMVALVPTLGFIVVKIHGPDLEKAAFVDLQAIAELKAEQIHRWLDARRGDGQMLMNDTEFIQHVRALTQRGSAQDALSVRNELENLQKAYGYAGFLLLDGQGHPVAGGGLQPPLNQALLAMLSEVFSGEQMLNASVRFVDDGAHRLDMLVPLFIQTDKGREAVGAVMMTMLPEQFLYPFMQRWPGEGGRGETLLVRGEAGTVVYMTPLSVFPPSSAQSAGHLLSERDLPAAIAIRSDRPGTAEGVDYRGIPVLAAFHPIEGTTWRLVAKVDREDVFAPLNILVLWISIVTFFAMAASGAALLMLWRKRMQLNQMALQTNADRIFRHFYDLPFLGMATCEPLTHKLQRVNARFCDILGYTQEELVGLTWDILSHPDEVPVERTEYDKLLDGTSEAYALEKRFIRRDGRVVHTSIDVRCVRLADGRADFIAAAVQDITEQRAMQQQLADSERNYRTLADSGQALIWRAGVDKRCYYFNKVWLEFTGRSLEQEFGDGWTEGVHPDDFERCLRIYTTAFDRHEAFSMDYRLRRHDGEYRWIQDDGSPCYDHAGRFIGYIGYCLDITDRYLTRQSLAQSEAKLRTVVSNLPIVLSTIASDGRFTMSEGKALEQMRRKPGELVGQHVAEVFRDRPELLECVGVAMQGRCAHSEHEEDEVWFESFYEPFSGLGKETGVMITSINVTERKHAEETLRMNVHRMECLSRIADYQGSVQELMNYALREILAVTDSQFGYLYRYDEDAAAFVGDGASPLRIPLAETGLWGCVVRQRSPLVVNWVDAASLKENDFPAGHATPERFMSIPVQAGERIVAVLGVANKPSDYETLDVDQMTMLMDSVWNLLERRRAREALQRATDQLRVSQALAQVGGWEYDTIAGTLSWTDETFRIHEVSPDSFTPQLDASLSFFSEESRPQIWSAIEHAIGLGQGFDLELGLLTARGHPRQVHMTCQVFREDTKVVRLTGAFQDITAYKRIERELREHQEHLEELVLLRTRELVEALDAAERATKAKSAFLANMSHEIRTPINAVLGMAHLAMRTRLTPKQREYLDKIMISANILLGVINDILDFSKIEAGRLELINEEFVLGDVLDKVIAVTGLKAADKRLEFLVRIATDVPPALVGDPVRLGQILINLCSNAVKFTDSGEVILSVAHAESRASDVAGILFAVRDTGIGMSEEQRKQLFSPFFQGDASDTRRFGGTGLGLAICKQLVEMMGGRIWANSTEGQGSEFCFTVPFGMGVAPPKPERLFAADLRDVRVLVVDRSVAGREILTSLLQGFGWHVRGVPSASEALATLQAHPEEPCGLLLLDWKESHDDAQELVRFQRAHHQNGRVILLAIGSEAENEALAKLLNPDVEVFKPVTASSLFDAVMTAFGRNPHPPEIAGTQLIAAELVEQLVGRRVLLVEDNAFNQQVATELLDAAGLIVVVAKNGQEAVERAPDGNFDLILMDVQMPVMDGVAATRRLRTMPELAHIPILAMTAHAMVDEQNHCLEAGMDDFLSKPIEPQLLFAKIAQWLTGRDKATARRKITVHEQRPLLRPPQAHSSDLPDSLPGISVAVGLRYCNDRASFFLRMLKEFVRTKANEAVTLRQFIACGDIEKATRLAHSMKSVAGSIGAGDLASAAQALERALREDAKQAWSAQIDAFDAALAEVVNGLRAAPCLADSVTTGPTGQVETQAVGRLMRRMLNTLTADMGETIRLMPALRRAISDAAGRERVAELESALNVFDTERASAILSQLLDECSGDEGHHDP